MILQSTYATEEISGMAELKIRAKYANPLEELPEEPDWSALETDASDLILGVGDGIELSDIEADYYGISAIAMIPVDGRYTRTPSCDYDVPDDHDIVWFMKDVGEDARVLMRDLRKNGYRNIEVEIREP